MSTNMFKEFYEELINMSISKIVKTFLLEKEFKKFTILGKIFIYPIYVFLFNFFYWLFFIMSGLMELVEYIFKIPSEMLRPLGKRIERLFFK